MLAVLTVVVSVKPEAVTTVLVANPRLADVTPAQVLDQYPMFSLKLGRIGGTGETGKTDAARATPAATV